MVADSGLGWAYTVAVNLTDANGSPLSGAVSAGGTTNVYGPGSLTTVIATGTAGDLGYGDYGLALAGTLLTTAGYYRWSIATITVGGYTFTNLAGGFSVGDIPPEYRTLRTIVVAVCEAIGLGIASTTTSLGSTTTLKDTRWFDAGRSSNEFVDDEIVILEPGATTDARPLRVTGYDPTTGSTGTFTFAPAVGANVASGTDYLLLRPGRRGLRYAQVIEAVVSAIADLATRQTVTDAVTLTTTFGTRQYTLPGALLGVERIEIAQQSTAWDPYWETVAPIYYDVWPDRRQINFKIDFGTQYSLRITGPVGVPEPRALGGIVKVPWTQARDVAVGYLSVPVEQRAGIAFRRGMQAVVR